MEEIQPIPFIKNFLLRYVDEAALQRRQSQAAEDDNPPSPTMVGGTYITYVNTAILKAVSGRNCNHSRNLFTVLTESLLIRALPEYRQLSTI